MDNRQLDALVAQARGWVKGRDELNQYDIWTAPNGRHYYDITLPHVSTDMAEAMALVEEWPGDYQIRRDGQDYIVSLFSGADVYVEMADTLKAAICLAYLKAKGVEVEQ